MSNQHMIFAQSLRSDASSTSSRPQRELIDEFEATSISSTRMRLQGAYRPSSSQQYISSHERSSAAKYQKNFIPTKTSDFELPQTEAESARYELESLYSQKESSEGRFLNDKQSKIRRAAAEHDGKNFTVVIRVRPPLPRELAANRAFQSIVEVDPHERVITLSENFGDVVEGAGAEAEAADNTSVPAVYTKHTFTFDHVYDERCPQYEVYDSTARHAVLSTLQVRFRLFCAQYRF
jgi:hypothetical protein